MTTRPTLRDRAEAEPVDALGRSGYDAGSGEGSRACPRRIGGRAGELRLRCEDGAIYGAATEGGPRVDPQGWGGADPRP
jgi:hypothetical protein